MLGEDFIGNEQAEAKKQRTLTLKVSYTSELADKLNTALHFVINKIGFKPLEEFTFIKGLTQMTLYDADGTTLIMDLQISGASLNTGNIVFHTDDCLRDYHKYIVSGVEFINRPEYTSAGLQVKFIDDQDNCYTLLEERTYTEP